MMNVSLPCILSTLLLLTACQTPAPSESQTRPPGETALSPAALAAARSGPVDFTRHVKPILEAKCVACHNHEALPGKVDLSNRQSALRTGGLGLWIVPGKPDQSLLLTKISDAPGHLQAMPVVGQQITPDEISVLRKWIIEGAAWPSGRPGALNIIQ
jgi:mono/diheme cytochrome c family protein